jgi:hypothetical protein
MSLITTVFSSNVAQKIAKVQVKNRSVNNYVATILVKGTFGGGTLAFALSSNNGETIGTTLIPLSSTPGGTQVSLTTASSFVFQAGNVSSNTQELALYATLSGATSPSIRVEVYDNNG